MLLKRVVSFFPPSRKSLPKNKKTKKLFYSGVNLSHDAKHIMFITKHAVFLYSTKSENSKNKKNKKLFSSYVNLGNHAEHAVRISQNKPILFSTRSENSKNKKIQNLIFFICEFWKSFRLRNSHFSKQTVSVFNHVRKFQN